MKISPLELAAPDIRPYRDGNTGVDYVTRFDSGRDGPHALITAIVHGNELCGAVALDFLFRANIRPTRGRLTLAFCNVAAYQRFDPSHPTVSRYIDEDFNRLWSPDRLDGARRSVELERARALRPIVDDADMLLDLHSMQNPTAPLMLSGPLEKGRRLAHAVAMPELIVADEGHSAGRRLRDYGGFSDAASPKNALLIECGQHWAKSSAETAKHTALLFLRALDMIAPETLTAHDVPPPPPRQRVIEVTHVITITADTFSFAADYEGLEVIAKAGTEIGRDGTKPVVTPYDRCVLIMPSRRLGPGQTAVRLGRFID